MKTRDKYYILNLGCPKNEIDGQSIEHHLVQRGLTKAEPWDADILIVNTCGFIDDAKRESIDEILRLAQFKRDEKLLAVTGCLSQRYREELKEELPEVDYFFGISEPEEIVATLVSSNSGSVNCTFDTQKIYKPSLGRFIDPGIHYAHVKISDGCDNHCSYCAIPSIRGAYRSRQLDDIVREVDFLLSKDIKEIILVGQETTRYGQDFRDKSIDLPFLVKELSGDKRLKWLRILYAHPARTEDSLLSVIAGNKQVCSYLDLPLQHISNKMLKTMNRHVTTEQVESLVSRIRTNYSEIALRTSFIIGHPGETERDFEKLMNFVEIARFDHLGCFIYSEEEGTVSANNPEKVDIEVAQERYDQLMLLQSSISEERNNTLLGRSAEAIIDEYDQSEHVYLCRLQTQAPEIDGLVELEANNSLLTTGDFVNIKITDYDMYDLKAVIDQSSSL